MTQKEDIRIIKKATCPSLSTLSTLTYNIGCDTSLKLYARIEDNTGNGHFNSLWVSIEEILKLLKKEKEPFTWKALEPLFKGTSLNNAGFIMAVLKHVGIVGSEQRRYVLKDTKKFMDEMKKASAKK